MKINLNIKNKKYFKLLNKITEISYEILIKFIKKHPHKYDNIIIDIELIPFEFLINERLTGCYAQAYFYKTKNKINKQIIEFSPQINAFNKRQLKLIVAHELAHSIDFLIRGENFKDHDAEWKEIAIILKTQPTFTIDIN